MKLNRDLFRQTNAYAMQFGGLFGLYWCVGFVCMLGGFQSSMLYSLYLLLFLSAPFVGIALARRFEREVRQDGMVDFGRAYLFSLMMYLYAIVILAGVAYIYFRMLDHGAFMARLVAQLHTPEFEDVMKLPQIQQQTSEMLAETGFDSLDELLHSFTPIMVAANIVDINLLFGLLFSIPTALLAKTPRRFMTGQSQP